MTPTSNLIQKVRDLNLPADKEVAVLELMLEVLAPQLQAIQSLGGIPSSKNYQDVLGCRERIVHITTGDWF